MTLSKFPIHSSNSILIQQHKVKFSTLYVYVRFMEKNQVEALDYERSRIVTTFSGLQRTQNIKRKQILTVNKTKKEER